MSDRPESEFWKRRRMIWMSTLSLQLKAMLVRLADYIGNNESAFVSVTALSQDLSLGRRQLQRISRELEGLKILKVEARPGKTSLTSIDWERVSRMSRVSLESPVSQETGEGCHECHGGGVTGDTGGVSSTSPEHTGNVQMNTHRNVGGDDEAFVFRCANGKTWTLPPEKLAEYGDTYRELDVVQELRFARQWINDNPTKRKTPAGMPRFLNRWLSNATKGLNDDHNRNGDAETRVRSASSRDEFRFTPSGAS